MPGIDITSANSSFVISCAAAAIASIGLEGYSVDVGVAMDAIESAIARKGIDGKFSAGWVPYVVPVTVTFEANSPSIDVMNAILTYSDAIRGLAIITGVLNIPSINRNYNFGKGVITSAQMMPNLERVLAPQSYGITFEAIRPSLAQ